MTRYLIISLILNFALFSLYSYWLRGILKTSFTAKKLILSPLEVKVFQVREQKSRNFYRKREKIIKSSIVSSKRVKNFSKDLYKGKSSRELINYILPKVEKEYQIFRKIVTTAKASYNGRKLKIISSRRLIYIPSIKPLKVLYPPSPVEVKITVLPDGRVINAVLIKKSGNPKVDKFVLDIVKNMKFEPIKKPVIQDIYIDFKFLFK